MAISDEINKFYADLLGPRWEALKPHLQGDEKRVGRWNRFASQIPQDQIYFDYEKTAEIPKEITRDELHQTLNKAFNTKTIAGEYGMTELMSQAYAIKEGIYKCPPHFKVMATEINDPFALTHFNKNGRLNIIDLANINSCCFIATDDLGKVYENGNFEVLGRIDHSDTRGCNLLV